MLKHLGMNCPVVTHFQMVQQNNYIHGNVFTFFEA